MELGVHLPQAGRVASPDNIAAGARLAEKYGYRHVWVSDHLVRPVEQEYPKSTYMFDPLLTLAWAAAATTTVEIGTSVLVLPQYQPVALANSLGSLDTLSNGRLILGAGVGWSEREFQALGQDLSNRGERMEEILDVLTVCWTTDPASYSGTHYAFEDIRVRPQPAREVPIWIGGHGPRARRRAVERGHGFIALGRSPEEMAEIARGLRSQRRDESFVVALRTGWDASEMPHAQILEELEAYQAAGVDHIVATPWQTTFEGWCDSVIALADLVSSRAA